MRKRIEKSNTRLPNTFRQTEPDIRAYTVDDIQHILKVSRTTVYAGQFHYEKVNGERPGKKYGKTLSPLTVAKVLGIPRSTANDLMNDGIVEFIWVDGKRRIKRESFDKWYASQSKYTKVKEIEEVEGYVD